MKKILIILLSISIFSCSQDNKGFSDYLKTLDLLELPLKFDINSKMDASKSYDSILFEKYKHVWTYAPFGIAFKKEGVVGIIEYSIADNGLAPFLITLDKQGNKIDSLNILRNTGFSEQGQTLESAILNADLKLIVTDSSKSWQMDKDYNEIPNTTELRVSTTTYQIQKNGKIKQIAKSKPVITRPKIEESIEEPTNLEPKEPAKLVVDNESQYSKKFISKLRITKGMEKIELREDMMILNEKDSITFPEYPRLNQKNILTGRKEDLAIALTVERNSFTSIEYKLEMVEFGKSSKIIKGIAELGVFFFFGSETDTDELSQEAYFSTQYSDTKDSCYTYIRIGTLEEPKGQSLLAKIVKNCNGEIRNIDLDDFPTLREK